MKQPIRRTEEICDQCRIEKLTEERDVFHIALDKINRTMVASATHTGKKDYVGAFIRMRKIAEKALASS